MKTNGPQKPQALSALFSNYGGDGKMKEMKKGVVRYDKRYEQRYDKQRDASCSSNWLDSSFPR